MKIEKQIAGSLLLPLIFVPFAWMLSCSHTPSEKEKVEVEISQAPSTTLGGPVALDSRKLIEGSGNLSSDQKEKLLALHARMAGEANSYRAEMGKMKMLLFKALMDPNAETSRVDIIKRKIMALDKSNLNKMLSALEDAQKILGRRSFNDEKLYRALMMDRVANDNM